ncbi:hypothetical protein R4Z10_18565 [Niallia sp. XMNu-256]|uniref:hypothetical protein n=1 Tax=Niallia sp. XMNu-256 TaxID=3082444 RepID=UPI0030CB4765
MMPFYGQDQRKRRGYSPNDAILRTRLVDRMWIESEWIQFTDKISGKNVDKVRKEPFYGQD